MGDNFELKHVVCTIIPSNIYLFLYTMFNLKKLLILIGFCSYFKIDTLKLGLHGSSEFMKVFASKVSIGIVLQ